MNVNIQKTTEYYKTAKHCDCDVCRYFCSHIRALRPDIAAYLDTLGVDIEKPFELVWLENDKDFSSVQFIGCQYIVFGTCEKDFSHKIGDIEFINNLNMHPSTDISEDHFVLDLGEITMDTEELKNA